MARGPQRAQPTTPRRFGEVLDYLGGLGFDHLYLRQPSRRAERAAPAGEAAAGGSAPSNSQPPVERFERLEAAREKAEGCGACDRVSGRRPVAFGSGHPNADLMLVGEGPGSGRERQSLPFEGPAGDLLDRILQAIDLRRHQVYTAYTLPALPADSGDSSPCVCRGLLEKQIDLVKPEVLVVLGRAAAQSLLSTEDPLGELRGRWHEVRGIATRVTYQPSALLRHERYKRPTWEDMKIVRDRLLQKGRKAR